MCRAPAGDGLFSRDTSYRYQAAVFPTAARGLIIDSPEPGLGHNTHSEWQEASCI